MAETNDTATKEAAAQTPALPSVEQANAYLDNIEAEAFFRKAAELGHVPSTQEEAQSMLALAGRVAQASGEKVASVNQYEQINREWDELGRTNPQYKQASANAEDREIWNLAAACLDAPDIYTAAAVSRMAQAG
jgi:hypothetical protein